MRCLLASSVSDEPVIIIPKFLPPVAGHTGPWGHQLADTPSRPSSRYSPQRHHSSKEVWSWTEGARKIPRLLASGGLSDADFATALIWGAPSCETELFFLPGEGCLIVLHQGLKTIGPRRLIPLGKHLNFTRNLKWVKWVVKLLFGDDVSDESDLNEWLISGSSSWHTLRGCALNSQASSITNDIFSYSVIIFFFSYISITFTNSWCQKRMAWLSYFNTFSLF